MMSLPYGLFYFYNNRAAYEFMTMGILTTTSNDTISSTKYQYTKKIKDDIIKEGAITQYFK